MSDFVVDYDELIRAAGGVDSVTRQFSLAHGHAETVASYVGHGGLKRKVNAFANEWDVGRSRLSNALEQLAAKYRAVVETLRELDSQMSTELREAATKAQNDAVARHEAAASSLGRAAGAGVAAAKGAVIGR